jgi:hypothetical protein
MPSRQRSEHSLFSTLSAPLAAGTKLIVPGVAGQGVRVYRLIISSGAAAGTWQFQDNANSNAVAGNPLSGIYNMAINSIFEMEMPINSDPWWTLAAGVITSGVGTGNPLGLQLTTTGGPISADIWFLQGL